MGLIARVTSNAARPGQPYGLKISKGYPLCSVRTLVLRRGILFGRSVVNRSQLSSKFVLSDHGVVRDVMGNTS